MTDCVPPKLGVSSCSKLAARLAECTFLELHALADDPFEPGIDVAFSVQAGQKRRSSSQIRRQS